MALGAAVAREMYDIAPPVLVLPPVEYAQVENGQRLSISEDGSITP